jgi:uncharacterized pyridoxamine 5'-phosphate oxidase family protein
MDKKEILNFFNANPACHLGTVEGDTPRTRGMLMYRADEKGVLFHTASSKDLFKQLQQNPKVELCFNNYEKGIQVRVSGVVEFLENKNLKEEIVKARPFLKPMVETNGYEFLQVFRITHGVATVWTMATNLGPKTYIKL